MRSSKPILLVEDDRAETRIAQKALNDLDIMNELVHKEHGETALEYLMDEHKQKPCIILLDLKIPGLSGLEVLRTLKGRNAKPKIVVLTGRPSATNSLIEQINQTDDQEEKTLKLADEVINKPFDIEHLLTKIKDLTEKKSGVRF